MPTQTGFWIQVKNGEVKQVWDYKPDAERMSTESGWRAASEVKPDLVDNREVMTTHSFDLDADPAQIVWAKRDLTVDDRKGGLVGQANSAFQEAVNVETAKQLDDDPASVYDAAAVATAQTTLTDRLAAINAVTTHDEVDAL
tara:strand:- start:155 stop:580 length:426 start_codon:yes stop_codon:yes gene_type:complete